MSSTVYYYKRELPMPIDGEFYPAELWVIDSINDTLLHVYHIN